MSRFDVCCPGRGRGKPRVCRPHQGWPPRRPGQGAWVSGTSLRGAGPRSTRREQEGFPALLKRHLALRTRGIWGLNRRASLRDSADPLQSRPLLQRRLDGGGVHVQGEGEVEGGAVAELAFGPDAATVALDDVFDDGQAEPGAALFA